MPYEELIPFGVIAVILVYVVWFAWEQGWI
jgi:hypothetical protein